MFQDDGGRLYNSGSCYIKVSKAIVDRYKTNEAYKAADEGLVLCVLLNNKDTLMSKNEGGRCEADPRMKAFLEGRNI